MGYLPEGKCDQTMGMDVFAMRQSRLREVMHNSFKGKQSLLAAALGVADTYVSRMLSAPDKAGHKRISGDFAREMEDKLKLPRGHLDGEAAGTAPKALPIMDFTPEAWEFAREWHKLEGPEKAQIQAYVTFLVGEQERDKRGSPHGKKPSAGLATPTAKVSITPSASRSGKAPRPSLHSRKKPGTPSH